MRMKVSKTAKDERLSRAVHGTRRHRSDGTVERFVSLWSDKNPQTATFVGLVDAETMDRLVRDGAWDHDFSPSVYEEGSSTEHWWKAE